MLGAQRLECFDSTAWNRFYSIDNYCICQLNHLQILRRQYCLRKCGDGKDGDGDGDHLDGDGQPQTGLQLDKLLRTELIFVTNITNYICGEKITMGRNFSVPCLTIVGKFKISPHVEKFQYNCWGFIEIYAVLLLNLLFTLFCHEIFSTIYALS